MRKLLLFIIVLQCMINLNAQNGDTISNAIEINGSFTSVSTFGDEINNSGLFPSCTTTEDIFYKHTVESGNNKMNIGMISQAITVLADINYQIFLAPNNDLTQLQELSCDFYTVYLLVGGSFEYVIDDIDSTNTYYLRVYKSSNVGASLADLMNGTTVNMTSAYDSTLSTNELILNDFNYIVDYEKIKLLNSYRNLHFNVYGLDGKKLLRNKFEFQVESIDISSLNSGVYVLNLSNNELNKSYKFIKQ